MAKKGINHPHNSLKLYLTVFFIIAKSRTVAVRLISMALTGYYKTLIRPRAHRPLSMLKYDPVGMFWVLLVDSMCWGIF